MVLWAEKYLREARKSSDPLMAWWLWPELLPKSKVRSYIALTSVEEAEDFMSRLREEQVMKENPYDTTFDRVEETYLQVLDRAVEELDHLLRPNGVSPALIPAGAAELRDTLTQTRDEAVSARKARLIDAMRRELLKYFPETVQAGLGTEESPYELEIPQPAEIFAFVRAAYNVYGELLEEA